MIKSGPSKFALFWAALTPLLLLATPLAWEPRPILVLAVYESAILIAGWRWLKE